MSDAGPGSWLDATVWLVRQSGLAQFSCGPEGDLLAFSSAYESLIGRRPSIGRAWDPSVDGLTGEGSPASWYAFLEGAPTFAVTLTATRGVGPRKVRMEAERVFAPSGQLVGYLGTCVDVTDLLESEAKAYEGSSLLEMVDGLLDVGHWHVHADTGRLNWSKQVHRIHGTDPESYQPVLEQGVSFYHPDDQARVSALVEEAFSRGEAFDFVARLVRADGVVRVVRSVGATIEVEGGRRDIFGVFQDITEQVEMLERVEASERRYALATEASRDGIWDWDVPTGQLFWSDRFMEIVGARAGDLQRRFADFESRLHPDDLQPTLDAVRAHLEHDVPYDVQYRLRHSSGRWIDVRAKGVASRDAEGNPTRMVGTVADVTAEMEQRRIIDAQNEALLEATKSLERRNQELDRFASIASHDMREPLRKVGWFTERVLARHPDLEERSRHELSRVRAAATRLSTMVSALLEYARAPAVAAARAEVDLDRVLAEVLEDHEEELRGTSLHVGELGAVWVHRQLMTQMLENLVSNAIKYAAPARPLELRIESEVCEGGLRLMVSDNGIGFQPEMSERIFGLFERLHGRDAYPGTGLGLAMVRRIAEEFGGRAWAEPGPIEGARFYVELPTRAASTSSPAVPASRAR